jgi:hypothetical protein
MRVLTDVELDVVSGGKKKYKPSVNIEIEDVAVATNNLGIKKIGKDSVVTIIQVANAANNGSSVTSSVSSSVTVS